MSRPVVPAAYPVLLEPLSPEDGGGYLATCPDLPGCTADGGTREEAIAEMDRAVAEWADEANRLGRPVPAPFSSRACAEGRAVH